MKTLERGLKMIVRKAKQLNKLPVLSEMDREQLEAKLRFDAAYYSNKLEGNELNKKETREAIFLN
jgi:hypothetical protein